jgi:hypothetical protein
MLFMVIETYRDGDAKPVYRRFKEKGRLAPKGVRYISSWVTTDFERCFQVMDCDSRILLEEWMSHWSDIVQFEVIPVLTSEKASAGTAPPPSNGKIATHPRLLLLRLGSPPRLHFLRVVVPVLQRS